MNRLSVWGKGEKIAMRGKGKIELYPLLCFKFFNHLRKLSNVMFLLLKYFPQLKDQTQPLAVGLGIFPSFRG